MIAGIVGNLNYGNCCCYAEEVITIIIRLNCYEFRQSLV